MATALTTEYTFTANITSKGLQGNGWKMEFDWKLPGSRFPFVLYGRDVEDLEGWGIGDRPEVTISRGNLKDGKDGRYATDYFYDLVSLVDTQVGGYEGPPDPPKQVPQPGSPRQGAAQADIPPNPAALGACHNHAVDFIVAGILPVPEGRELTNFIWELRDRFYRNINQKPLAPPHYCYQHDTQRIQSSKTGAWGHILPDKTGCIEAATDAESV